MTTTEILGDLRHACSSCGGSCSGVNVQLVDEEERARIHALAEGLGVDHPTNEGGVLRRVEGRCCFQDAATELCRIHAAHGAEAKPHLCQQFPVIATKVEDGTVRVGVDPACYAAVLTWRDGPLIPDAELYFSGTPYEEGAALRHETTLIDLMEAEDMTVARALGVLTGARPEGDALPEGLGERVVLAVARMDLGALLDLPDAGPALGRALRPLAEAATTWQGAPPWPALDAEGEAWALEATRRVLWLRLARRIPSVPATALLVLTGAVACAWVAADTPHFGAMLAGWVRGLRAPAFLHALAPEPTSLHWLARG